MEDRIVLEGEWLSSRDAAARLGVNTSRLFKLVRDGRLAYQMLPGGRRLYPGKDVDRLRSELDAWNPRGSKRSA